MELLVTSHSFSICATVAKPNPALKDFQRKIVGCDRGKACICKSSVLGSFVRLRFQNGGAGAILEPGPACDQYPKDKQSAGKTL